MDMMDEETPNRHAILREMMEELRNTRSQRDGFGIPTSVIDSMEESLRNIPEKKDEAEPGLYDRQEKLDLNIPEEVCILGVGGIGSWVALNMGLIGVKKLHMIDYDLIEEHNLNRTPFREMDIDTKKTMALMDLILERRADAEIQLYDKRLEEFSEYEINEIKGSLLIDCRDNIEEFPEELKDTPKVKLGYDGLSATIILNPDYSSVWEAEENTGYQVVPSFLAPCQFLATAIVTILTNKNFTLEGKDNQIITIDLQKHFEELTNEAIYGDNNEEE